MNCCDEYGKCTQGEGCPVRTTHNTEGEPVTHGEALPIYLIITAGCVILVGLLLRVVVLSL